MQKPSIEDIKRLREETGVAPTEIKKALEESKGDFEKAKELLRTWGKKIAGKKVDREAKQGIIDAVASVHDLDPKVISQIGYHTQKWEPGAYARKHSDNTDEHGHSGAFTRSRYAAFLYLNDDFEGGMLQFPDQEISLQPKVGMLAAFDGGFNNMHEVTLITSGVRYTIGSFWDDREESDYPQELRDAWAEEMKATRAQQEIERAEWQDLLKQGWKLDSDGNKYKAEDL